MKEYDITELLDELYLSKCALFQAGLYDIKEQTLRNAFEDIGGCWYLLDDSSYNIVHKQTGIKIWGLWCSGVWGMIDYDNNLNGFNYSDDTFLVSRNIDLELTDKIKKLIGKGIIKPYSINEELDKLSYLMRLECVNYLGTIKQYAMKYDGVLKICDGYLLEVYDADCSKFFEVQEIINDEGVFWAVFLNDDNDIEWIELSFVNMLLSKFSKDKIDINAI